MLLRSLVIALWLLLTARSVLPFVFTYVANAPHAHLVIGNVSQAELEAHEQANHTNMPVQPHWRGGIILSLFYGDPTGFFSAFFVIAILALDMLVRPSRAQTFAMPLARYRSFTLDAEIPPPRA